MELVVIAATAFCASALTLFSGFGLGTLLMPVVAIFLPIDVAIAVTAMVHLANNLFKGALLGRRANREVLLRFGLPAVIASFGGALLLGRIAALKPLMEYGLLGATFQVTPVKAAVGVLILLFVFLELWPPFAAMNFASTRRLPYGGLLSGFFGGLSGHQGAFRSMFLLRLGMDKEEFVATCVLLAVMVDCARMLVYGWGLSERPDVDFFLVVSAALSAFAGAYLSRKILKKVTMRLVHALVTCMLCCVALGLVCGVL